MILIYRDLIYFISLGYSLTNDFTQATGSSFSYEASQFSSRPWFVSDDFVVHIKQENINIKGKSAFKRMDIRSGENGDRILSNVISEEPHRTVLSSHCSHMT